MITDAKRAKMEKLIYDFFGAIDKSGTNVKKYNELLNKIKNDVSPQKIEKIRCAMKFNESMGELTKKHKWKSIKIIISNFLCGNYKYFTKKSCGVMFGDILFLFID